MEEHKGFKCRIKVVEDVCFKRKEKKWDKGTAMQSRQERGKDEAKKGKIKQTVRF